MGFFDTLFKVLTFGLFTKVMEWLIPKPQGKDGIKVGREGSDQAIPVVYGTRKVGAIKVHKYVTDTPVEAWNDLLHVICVFAEGECDNIEELFFNGISENDDQWSGGRLDGKWFKAYRYNGAVGQPASAEAVSGIPNWTINHRLDGLCYVYIIFQQSEAQDIWRGEPQVQARIRGKKILDTRTGLTAYSENPAMCVRDYITNDIYGMGKPDSFINTQALEAVANDCDEGLESVITTTSYPVDTTEPGRPEPKAITTTQTVTLPRFSCNLIIDTEQDPLSNLNELISSFRGIVQDMTSSAKFTYETAGDPVYLFTADKMLDDVSFDSGNVQDRYNSVEVRFPNKAKDYETDSVFYPENGNPLAAQWLAEDNGILQDGSFELDSITSKAEALQMAEIIAKRSRFTKSVSFSGMPETIVVEIGDIVGFDSQMLGWTEKPFRVVEKELQDDDSIKFTLSEHENAAYPWSGATFDEVVGGTWLGDPTNMAAPDGLTITPDLTLATTGRLRWNSTLNSWVRRYEVQIVNAAGIVIFDVDVIGNSWSIPLLDVGEYTAYVFAVSSVGYRSPSAGITFNITAPVQPSSITLTPRDWEIEAAAQLTGIGLGTVFEYDIVAGDGAGYTPASKGRATTFTFTGLLPDTLYTVFARTVNAIGVSDWVSASATTTSTGAQVEPYLQSIRDELDDVETVIGDIDTEIVGINTSITELSADLQSVADDVGTIHTDIDGINLSIQDITVDLGDLGSDITTITTEVGNLTTSIGEINDELDLVDSSLFVIGNNLDDLDYRVTYGANQGEDLELLALDSILQQSASREDLRARLESDEQLIGAVVYVDPTTGTIVNRAYQYTDASFTQAAVLIDGVDAKVTLLAEEVGTIEGEVNTLSSELALVPAQITATANAVVADAISALEPAHTFNFFDSAQGWTAVNGTLVDTTPSQIQVTWGDIQNTALNFSADDNTSIRITIERTGGTGWVGDLFIQRDDTSTETFAGIIEDVPVGGEIIRIIDMRGVENWDGTVTSLRLALGTTTDDTFTIKQIVIGKPDANLLELQDITARVTQAELDINAVEGELTQRVTTSYYNNNTVTYGNVEQVLSASPTIAGIENNVSLVEGDVSAVVARVDQVELDVDGTTTAITALEGQVNNPTVNNSALYNFIQTAQSTADGNTQSITGLTNRVTDAEADISANATLLQEVVSDVDGNTSSITNLTNRIDTAEGDIVANAGLIQGVRTDVDDNITAISALEGSVNDPTTGLSAAYTLAGEAKSTADGNSTALTNLTTRVTDAESDIAANASLIQQVELDVSGNTSSLTSLTNRVTDAEGDITANTSLLQTARQDIDGNITAISALEGSVNDPQTGLAITYTNASNALSLANGNASSITTLGNRITDAEGDIVANAGLIQGVRTDVDGNSDAIALLQGSVNDPTTGLSAAYQLANTANITADNNASSISVLEGSVNDPATGLAATYTIASSAETLADGNATSITSLTNRVTDTETDISTQAGLIAAVELDVDNNSQAITALETSVNDPATGLSATNQIAQQASTTANGNAQAITELDTRVTTTEGFTEAQIILNSEYDEELGQLGSSITNRTFQIVGNYEDFEDSQLQQLDAVVSVAEARAGQLDRNLSFADAISRIEVSVGENGAIAKAITQLEAVTNTQEGLIEANAVSVQQVRTDLDGAADSITVLQGQVNDPQDNSSALYSFIQTAQQTADNAQSAATLLENQVNDPTTGLGATFSLAGKAEQDAANNFSSIAALTVRVEDNEGDILAQAGLISQAQQTADDNTTAINSLTSTVNDPVSGLSATNTLAQNAFNTADGNTQAITQLDARVTGNENFATAQLQLNVGYDSDLDELFARAFLGTDVNDVITGIVIDGVTQQIEFQADSFAFLDGSGTPMVYWDAVNGRYVFDGHIIAQTGTFSGTVQSGSFVGGDINIGSGTFTVDSNGNMVANSGLFKGVVDIERGGSRLRIDPSNDLMFWFGPDNIPVESQGRDNGAFWIASDGLYSVPVNRTVFSGAVTTGVVEEFLHLTVKGGADLECRYKFENFNLNNIQSINGNNHSLTFTLKKGGIVIGTTTVPVTVIGSPPGIVSAESGEVVITTSFDNSTLAYFTEQDFSIETSVNWDITFTTPTMPTMEGSGFVRISELRTLS